MPRPHTTMRKIRDVLRLVLRDNVSRRTAARSLSVPRSSVNDLVARVATASLTWEVTNELDDTQLAARRIFVGHLVLVNFHAYNTDGGFDMGRVMPLVMNACRESPDGKLSVQGAL